MVERARPPPSQFVSIKILLHGPLGAAHAFEEGDIGDGFTVFDT